MSHAPNILDELLPTPDSFVLYMPLPPSVNHAYVNAKGKASKGRFKSKALRDFNSLSVLWMREQLRVRPWPFSPKCKLTLEVIYYVGSRSLNRRDLDNFHKALQDIVAFQMQFNDALIFHTRSTKKLAVREVEGTIMLFRSFDEREVPGEDVHLREIEKLKLKF